MPSVLLADITIIFGLGLAVVYICQRLRLPSIVGFLITGLLAGPQGLGLIADPHEVEILAEIGVVLLLFSIGLEFSFAALMQIKRPMLLGGSLQVGLTIAAVAGLVLWTGRTWQMAVFAGCVLALSSTAIVLKLLQERAVLDTPQGRVALAVLIFQDVAVVAMLLVTPLLGGGAPDGPGGLVLLAKGLAAVAVLAVAAKWGVPWVLRQVANTKSRELFIVTIVVICLAVAWLTAWAGLSLALGAFLAGLLISQSPYSHQAIGHVLPMRDLFTSLFFVSIGMLLDLGYLAANPVAVGLTTLGVMVLKTVTGSLAAIALRLPLRVALPAGLILAQVGEFAFVLAKNGLAQGLMDRWHYQLMLNYSVLTMALTPALVALAQRMASRPGPHWRFMLKNRPAAAPLPEQPSHVQSGHVIVVGYGLGGRNVARAARLAGIPYLVLEMNPFTVRQEQGLGEPIVFGDAVNPAVLEHARVDQARVLVVTIPDPVAARHVAANAKQMNPALHVIVRARYLAELGPLRDLGADEVVSEEYESAVEIFARLLRRFLLPQAEIERLVAELRAEGYEMLRGPEPAGPAPACDLAGMLPEMEMATLAVVAGAPAVGRSLADLDLRQRHGLTVLAIRREGVLHPNPRPDKPLAAGDWLVIMARPEAVAAARPLFCAPEQAA